MGPSGSGFEHVTYRCEIRGSAHSTTGKRRSRGQHQNLRNWVWAFLRSPNGAQAAYKLFLSQGLHMWATATVLGLPVGLWGLLAHTLQCWGTRQGCWFYLSTPRNDPVWVCSGAPCHRDSGLPPLRSSPHTSFLQPPQNLVQPGESASDPWDDPCGHHLHTPRVPPTGRKRQCSPPTTQERLARNLLELSRGSSENMVTVPLSLTV